MSERLRLNRAAINSAGVVGLEVCRLVRDVCVTRGVRFIERIRSERLPVGPYLLAYFGIVAAFRGTAYEVALHLVEHGALLLTHSLTQGVGLTFGETCQLLRQKHHLFLIDGDAVGVVQILLHVRQGRSL